MSKLTRGVGSDPGKVAPLTKPVTNLGAGPRPHVVSINGQSPSAS
jgi:hypothetical protein